MDDQGTKPPTMAAHLAHTKRARATRHIATGLKEYDPERAAEFLAEAEEHESVAQAIIAVPEPPPVGPGGEFDMPDSRFRDTSQDPNLATVEASQNRLDLAFDVDCLPLAIDTAETIEAQDSIEKMLAHEMAAAHTLAMRFAAKANNMLAGITSWDRKERQQVQSIEAVRLAGASTRLMRACQESLITLQKHRSKGRQVVVVQYVQVNEGGQAVVAGKVSREKSAPETPRKTRGRPRK